MDYKNLFEKFNEGGKLLLKDATVTFDAIPWSKHPAFEGVELKAIITSERTDGRCSYHRVRIASNKKMGNLDQALCLADAVLDLELVRRKPYLGPEASDKVVFAQKNVLCHFLDRKFAFWV